ncbi:class IIb bacteriocin, lactobin A/cerein 7B family [Alteromonas oceanisediminis]|uniref:class IIb bacteriocin, lactobin A/cerein 7B family n=1 Tax=Alteromonas oceanisediminis TaxID=2836180 RepID=UPI001BD95906|nr:class IIb bacteriocin, lactobin A/cerein 7B family [Alteromonas oceanisediminis]MBT0587388.1 class IIb bacteriocin, lactobin A/cerein 7B family [Alteromonas oceanisediminis]
MDIVSDNDMFVLSNEELEEVNGGFLVNIAMGIVGSAAAMGAYSMSGWSSGLTGAGFAGAAAGGFVAGAGGFTPVSASAGAATAGLVVAFINSTDDE